MNGRFIDQSAERLGIMPERLLGAAVLKMAISDGDRDFLRLDCPSFLFWCSTAGLSAELVLRLVEQNGNGGSTHGLSE